MQSKELVISNDFHLPSPSDFFSYARAVAQIPSLSKKDESDLIEKWTKNKDAMAAKYLVLSNLHLVVKIVNNHKGYGLPQGDLAQEGTVGLMKAVHKFNPKKGVRLATYAWYWIEAEIKEFILKNWRMISWGTSTLAKKLFFGYRKTIASLQKIGEERQLPSASEIAKSMDVSEKDAHMAHRYFMGGDVEIVEDYENDEGTYRQDVAMIETDITPYDEAVNYEKGAQVKAIEHFVGKLSDRHQKILKGRYFSDPQKTLSFLAKDMNLSIERVRQLEKEGIEMIKENFI